MTIMIRQKHGENLSYCIKLISVSVITSLLIVQNAFAYIDPGSGAIAVQMLMAAIATGIGYVIIFYQHIKVKIYKVRVRFFGEPAKESPVDEKK